jgi:hypothetical protein
LNLSAGDPVAIECSSSLTVIFSGAAGLVTSGVVVTVFSSTTFTFTVISSDLPLAVTMRVISVSSQTVLNFPFSLSSLNFTSAHSGKLSNQFFGSEFASATILVFTFHKILFFSFSLITS